MKTLSAKSMIDVVRPEINSALAAIAKKHGLKELRTAGGATYSDEGFFCFKVEGVVAGGQDKAAALYQSAGFLKLPPLGTSFRNKGVDYKICGLNTTGTKVIGETPTGKRYLFPVEMVKRLCGRTALIHAFGLETEKDLERGAA